MHAEGRHPRRARVLDTAVIDRALPAGVRRQDDAGATYRRGDAVLGDHLGQPDARDIAGGDEPRQQPQPAVGVAAARRVQDALGLERLARAVGA